MTTTYQQGKFFSPYPIEIKLIQQQFERRLAEIIANDIGLKDSLDPDLQFEPSREASEQTMNFVAQLNYEEHRVICNLYSLLCWLHERYDHIPHPHNKSHRAPYRERRIQRHAQAERVSKEILKRLVQLFPGQVSGNVFFTVGWKLHVSKPNTNHHYLLIPGESGQGYNLAALAQ